MHLPVDLQRLLIMPLITEAICPILRPKKAPAALPRQVAHPRPQVFCEPHLHCPCEALPARLARHPHRVASVLLLPHRFADETVDVRQATVSSTRAATLDRGRIEFKADGARSGCISSGHRGIKELPFASFFRWDVLAPFSR